MKICLHDLRWQMCFLFCFCIFTLVGANAQQRSSSRTGTRTGSSRSTGGSSYGSGLQQYNPNGWIGNAIISIDTDSHNITVIADEETTKSISQVVSNLDKPQPQALIKVVFVEVTHNNASDIGIEGGWSGQVKGSITGAVANAFGLSALSQAITSNSPSLNVFKQPVSGFQAISPFTGTGAGLYQILGTDFQATLRAIAQAGKAELLSRPSILARNNQPATIVVGQSVPLITNVRYDSLGNAINSITYNSVGIILKVTPFITGAGMVQMIVAPQISAIDSTTSIPISSNVSVPVINVRSADTVVLTPDGQTVVIGGLMSNIKAVNETKIPLLGDIPLIGRLFKRNVESVEKKELLIFLTPHIVQAPNQIAALSEGEKERLLSTKSTSEKDLDVFLDKVPAKKSTEKKSDRKL